MQRGNDLLSVRMRFSVPLSSVEGENQSKQGKRISRIEIRTAYALFDFAGKDDPYEQEEDSHYLCDATACSCCHGIAVFKQV